MGSNTAEYKKMFYASLDAQYAKEIQDLYANYMDGVEQKEQKAASNDLKMGLRKFNQKLTIQKFKSAPLCISILNVAYGLSRETRNNLDQHVVKEVRDLTTSIFNLFKHSILVDEDLSQRDEEIIGDVDDFERILYLAFETSFNIAHDGIKHRKSKDIFNLGIVSAARILSGINKNHDSEKFIKYELRYDQLENSVNDSGIEVEKLKSYVKLLKKRYTTDDDDEKSQAQKELNDYKFNAY